MSRGVMISGAHWDSLTQEPLCDSPGNCNQTYSADATSTPHPDSRRRCCRSSSAPWLPSFLPFFTHRHPFPLLPPRRPTPTLSSAAAAARRRLRVICGHFSFIILSKSGTALPRVDWVSVKHQDLIEFVLKRVLLGALLIQSGEAHQVRGL